MTAIEKQVAAEVAMLKDIIAGTKEQIELMIEAGDCWEVINESRIDLACYQADLAAYN